jgi:alpha-1,3-mannosyl-glycoprotein beta-1,2-N-acetylglucosaminyltransferase
LRGYFKIARHYKWAIDEVFMKHKFQTVILNEDDLNISPDFFSYFEAMEKVLNKDTTLYCVSAWNDNGKTSLINSKDIGKLNFLYL